MNNSNQKNQHKYIDRIFGIIFILVFLVVPAFWIFRKPARLVSQIENRVLTNFPEELFKSFNSEEEERQVKVSIRKQASRILRADYLMFFDEIESAASDQFPFREFFIRQAKAYDRMLIKSAYAFLPDVAYPADMVSHIYFVPEDEILITRPAFHTQYSMRVIDKYIANYDQVIDEHPDINFMVFYYQMLAYSEHHPLNDYFYQSDKGQNYTYFMENKPEELVVSQMMLPSYEEHAEWYFATDHHWNVFGMLKAYDIIYEMIREETYPEISPKRMFGDVISFSDLTYLGSHARKTQYPVQPELFEVIDFQLPEYRVTNHAGKIIRYDSQEQYLSGKYTLNPFANHYGNFYGRNAYLLKFEFDNSSERTLLIVGSSFANPLQPLIASHYKTTYTLDLREVKNFSFAKFMEQYPVDDVLIIGSNTEVLSGPRWYLNP